ncbi:MAG TPA: hypothetical protein VFK29_00150 [Rhodanobacteraceae bacterium]|nr:hypothetical protein [Rhodanobacteraceae bacterium]
MSDLELALKLFGLVLVVLGSCLAVRYRKFGDGSISNGSAAMPWHGRNGVDDCSGETRRHGARWLRTGLWAGFAGAVLQLVAIWI